MSKIIFLSQNQSKEFFFQNIPGPPPPNIKWTVPKITLQIFLMVIWFFMQMKYFISIAFMQMKYFISIALLQVSILLVLHLFKWSILLVLHYPQNSIALVLH